MRRELQFNWFRVSPGRNSYKDKTEQHCYSGSSLYSQHQRSCLGFLPGMRRSSQNTFSLLLISLFYNFMIYRSSWHLCKKHEDPYCFSQKFLSSICTLHSGFRRFMSAIRVILKVRRKKAKPCLWGANNQSGKPDSAVKSLQEHMLY